MSRKNGDGTWGKRTINGNTYEYFQKMYGYKPTGEPNVVVFYGRNKKGETAKQEIRRKRDAYEKKENLLPLKEFKKQTLSEYLDWYLYEFKRKRSDSKNKKHNVENTTYDGYVDLIQLIKTRRIGDIPIGNLNENSVLLFQNLVIELLEGLARSTVEKLLILLNLAIKQGVKDSKIAYNPIPDVYLPPEKDDLVKKKKKDVPYLEAEDREKLKQIAFAVYDGKTHKGGKIGTRIFGNNAIAVLIIMFTGLRVSELIGMKLCNYNRDLKYLKVKTQLVKVRSYKSTGPKYVWQEKGLKSDESYRTIPLLDETIGLIEYFVHQFPDLKPNDYFFLNTKREHLDRSNIYRTLNKMLKKANCSVEEAGLHALRHSFGSIILDNAEAKGEYVDMLTISRLLGHADVKTTEKIYIHKSNKNMRKAIQYLECSETNEKNDEKTIDAMKQEIKEKIPTIKEQIDLLGNQYQAYVKMEPVENQIYIMDYHLQPKENTFPMSLENILSTFITQLSS